MACIAIVENKDACFLALAYFINTVLYMQLGLGIHLATVMKSAGPSKAAVLNLWVATPFGGRMMICQGSPETLGNMG